MTRSTTEPDSPDSLEKRILDAFPRLTEKQRRVARVLLADHLSVAFSSVDLVGKRAGVDPATVIRFARLLGYSGWVDLRASVRAEVPALRTAAQKVSTSVAGGENAAGSAARHAEVVEHDLRNIRETAILNDDDTLDEAIEAIAGARRVYVGGVGFEAVVADMLTLQLRRNGVPVTRIDRNLATSALDVAQAGEEDVAIVISVWRYTRDSVRMMQEACRGGARGIALTDSLVSPVAQEARLVLLAADGAPRLSHSMTGMLSLVNVLVDGVARVSRERSVATLQRIDSMFEEFDVFE